MAIVVLIEAVIGGDSVSTSASESANTNDKKGVAREGGEMDATPNRFFQLFSEMQRAFLQTKFLPVGSSLGYLSMKNFQMGHTVLGVKLDKGREGAATRTSGNARMKRELMKN